MMVDKDVGIFITCLVDAIRPQIGIATLKLLRAAGVSPIYPPAQTCCGQIAYNGGYREQAATLVKHCATIFADCKRVVIPSGSCCGFFCLHSAALAGDNPEIKQFSEKCVELSQFLEELKYTPPSQKPMSVAYHDSCTGLRELGIKNTPRRLLSSAGISVVEITDGEECCGFGGSFAEKFGDISSAIGEKKCANIIAANADAVVMGDSGCLLHIEGCLRRQNNHLPVMHWAEVLAAEIE